MFIWTISPLLLNLLYQTWYVDATSRQYHTVKLGDKADGQTNRRADTAALLTQKVLDLSKESKDLKYQLGDLRKKNTVMKMERVK